MPETAPPVDPAAAQLAELLSCGPFGDRAFGDTCPCSDIVIRGNVHKRCYHCAEFFTRASSLSRHTRTKHHPHCPPKLDNHRHSLRCCVTSTEYRGKELES